MELSTNEIRNKKIIDFIVEKRFRTLRHVIFLVGLFLLFYNSNLTEPKGESGETSYNFLFLVYFVFVFMLYSNMYVLVPHFFFKNHYLLYLIMLIVLVFLGLRLISLITYLSDPEALSLPAGIRSDENFARRSFRSTSITIPIILLTTTIKLLQRWIADNKRINELKNATLNIELNALKNQINPHFLFNMLNNVKALIRTSPEKASGVIIKLSEFLRYQLYENNEEKTSLHSELAFLKNFLSLEQIRRDSFKYSVVVDLPESSLSLIYIPPNLFTTFVENAVKHSYDPRKEETFIAIQLVIADDKLCFTCINSYKHELLEQEKKTSGLGLPNIKRRLTLLYGEKHRLNIKTDKQLFTIQLTFPI